MLKKMYWKDSNYSALIGEKPVNIISTQHDCEEDMHKNQEAQVVLFCYQGKTNIYALRWTIGAVLNMGTTDAAEAQGSIQAMASMESSDEY
jgi:hypothetical protein